MTGDLFDQLRAAGIFKPGPGPDYEGACPACGRVLKAVVLGDGRAPDPRCSSECSPEEIAAAIPSAGSLDPALRFISTRELHDQAPPVIPWVWDGYLARGSVTLIAGRPKAGKSTLITAVVQAVAADAPTFLNHEITGCPVLVLSEEGHSTLKHKLPPGERIRVANRQTTWPLPSWPTAIRQAADEAVRVGAGLLVIDTFTFWAQLASKDGNDTGAVAAAMRALTVAARAGLAVVLIHHQGKGGGEDGMAVLGSTQFAADVDLIVEVERVADRSQATQRQILAVGRFDETPGALVYDRDPATGALGVVGEAAGREEVRALGLKRALWDALPVGEPGVSTGDLEDELGDKRVWKRLLDRLVEGGEVRHRGKGVKGDPKVFWRAADSVPDGAVRNAYGMSGKRSGGDDSFWGVPVGNPRIIGAGDSVPINGSGTESSATDVARCEDGGPADLLTGEELVDALLADPDLGAVEITPATANRGAGV